MPETTGSVKDSREKRTLCNSKVLRHPGSIPFGAFAAYHSRDSAGLSTGTETEGTEADNARIWFETPGMGGRFSYARSDRTERHD